MAAFWRGRVAALIVLLTVLGHWFSGPGDTPAWMRLLAILVVSLFVVVLQNRRHLINVIKTLPRDIRFLLMFFHVSRTIKKYERENMTVIRKLEEHARSKPDKVCFLFNEERWTYREVDAYSNRVARAFLAAGVGRGDVVALLMTNRVEYVCVWLGLAKIGAVTALINWNLRDAPLAHTINTARAKGVLCSEDFVDAVEEVRGNLETVKTFHRFGDRNLPDHDRKGWAPFLPLLEAESADKPAVALEPAYNDVVLYIYTSGTTGLPKAAIVSHARVMFCPIGAKMTAALDPDRDVHYCSLPLYHAAAGAYATSLALAHDIPVAITAKFSASKFWTEASHQGATTVQYIGELCRFLVLAPEGPHDRKHKVRALLGNGMSPAVWRRVQTRFGVPEVFELYGSTEGNVMMVNPDGKVGAMGFMPRLVPRTLWPVDVVQVDEETMDPVRDDDTKLCIRSKEGAAGMLVGKIIDNVVSSEFVGYLDLEATGKKILQNVFSQGDRYFVTGDLAVVDDLGYFYFKDRTGDTYRWKGENVSTAEVEAVITSVLLPFGVREVAAYGVQIPGHEGRAGMAAIADPDNHADLDILAEKLTRKLPRYALPVFVRVMDSLPMTGTHKVSKMLLQRDGFHVQDPVFVFNIKTARYEPLTEDTMEDIRENRMRF